MKCVFCKVGEVEEGTASVLIERDGSTIVFKQVPALVCNNCGEEYFRDEVLGELEEDVDRLVEQGVELEVRTHGK